MRIIAVQPRNQPSNQSTPHQSEQLKQHCFWVGLQARQLSYAEFIVLFVQWQQLNTSWSTHVHAHMQHPPLGFRLDLFFRSLLYYNTGICAIWAVHVTLSIRYSLAIQDVHLNFHSFHALPYVFMRLAYYCCCLKNVSWQGWCCWAFFCCS